MAIHLSRTSYNKYGDPKVTITIEGAHDLYRFAHHLTYGQVEFCEMGTRIKNRMKRRAGKAKWQSLQRYFHGDGRPGSQA